METILALLGLALVVGIGILIYKLFKKESVKVTIISLIAILVLGIILAPESEEPKERTEPATAEESTDEAVTKEADKKAEEKAKADAEAKKLADEAKKKAEETERKEEQKAKEQRAVSTYAEIMVDNSTLLADAISKMTEYATIVSETPMILTQPIALETAKELASYMNSTTDTIRGQTPNPPEPFKESHELFMSALDDYDNSAAALYKGVANFQETGDASGVQEATRYMENGGEKIKQVSQMLDEYNSAN